MDIMHMDCGKCNYVTVQFEADDARALRELGDIYLLMSDEDREQKHYHLAETHLSLRNKCYDMAEAMEEKADYIEMSEPAKKDFKEQTGFDPL